MNAQTAFAALLRSDLRTFIRQSFLTILPGTAYLPNWHIDAIVYQLMAVQAGDISRLLINQPPRSLKSICVSVASVAPLKVVLSARFCRTCSCITHSISG
jgi:hypothetical protein